MYSGLGSPSFRKIQTEEQVISGGTSVDYLQVRSNYIRVLTGSLTIRGIIPRNNGDEITIFSQSATVQFIHQYSITRAEYRINTPSNSTFTLSGNQSAVLKYSPSVGWRIIYSPPAISFPLSYSANTIQLPQASNLASGYLSASDWNTFTNKWTSDAPVLKGIAYCTATASPRTLSTTSYLTWDEDVKRFTSGLTSASAEAANHLSNENGGLTAQDLGGLSANLVEFVPLGDVTGSSISTNTPNIGECNTLSAACNYTGSGYTANGDTIQYRIFQYVDNSGDHTICAYLAETSVTDDGSTNPYSVDVYWSEASSIQSIAGVVIERNINGNGWNDHVVLSTGLGSFVDDNTGWVGGAFPYVDVANDFTALGLNHDFEVFAFDTSPIPQYTNIYSVNPDIISYTEPNTGATYRMVLINGSGPNNNRKWIYYNIHSVDASNQSSIEIGPYDLTNNDNVSTPRQIGYLSDGTNLNLDFTAYGIRTSGLNNCYSANGYTTNTVDPNDGLYYYVQLALTLQENGYKVIMTPTGGSPTVGKQETGGSPFTDYYPVYDSFTAWTDGIGVSPTVLVETSLRVDSKFSSSSDLPSMVLKSVDGDYFRTEYWNSSNAKLGEIELDIDGLKIDNLRWLTFNPINSASVPNNTLFRDSGTGKLCYKDDSGVVNDLY